MSENPARPVPSAYPASSVDGVARGLPGPDAGAWDDLAAQSQNIFLTRDFAEAWWAAYQPRGRPMVLADHSERPRCILPLYSSGGPIPLIRQIGHGPADELGPLCALTDREVAADLVRSELRKELRRGVLVLHDAAVDDGWVERLGGGVVRSTAGPVVRLGMASWDDFLATRSKSFRKETRRHSARLYRAFDVTMRVSTSDTLEDDVSTLLHLHRLRWGARAPFAAGKEADLVRRFARRALERGWLRLSVMELDGRPAAADLGLRFAGVHSSWQGGWDPDYKQHSVGAILMMDSLRAAVEDGKSEYRLLRGDEAYKQRLADVDRGTSTVALAHGWAGGAVIRAARARREVQPRLSALGHAAGRLRAGRANRTDER